MLYAHIHICINCVVQGKLTINFQINSRNHFSIFQFSCVKYSSVCNIVLLTPIIGKYKKYGLLSCTRKVQVHIWIFFENPYYYYYLYFHIFLTNYVRKVYKKLGDLTKVNQIIRHDFFVPFLHKNDRLCKPCSQF